MPRVAFARTKDTCMLTLSSNPLYFYSVRC